MNNVRDLLTQFSFSTPEIDIYLAALSLERAGVTELAKKAGLNRTAAYFHINHLVQKHALKETRAGKTLQFVATPPGELTLQLDEKLTALKSLVPQLEALKQADDERPTIEMVETTTGYYKVYDRISSMPEGSTFRVIEGRRALISELSMMDETLWNTFFHRVVQRNIVTRGIFTKESLVIPQRDLSKETNDIFAKRIWHLRTVSEEILPLDQLALIYGNNVSLLFPDSSFVMTITHAGIANLFTSMFDAIFHFAEVVERPWE